MKKLLSLVLSVALLCGILMLPAEAVFTDVTDPDTALAASVLQGLNVTEGVGGGRYSPDAGLTRAQFCTFAIRVMGLDDQAQQSSYKAVFSDVKPGSWYTGYVNLAYSEGLVNGYGNGKFGPDDSVTYGQVATILLRLLGYTSDDVGKVWPTDYTRFAAAIDIDAGLSLGAYSTVTRGQMAELLYNAIRTETNGTDAKYYTTINGVSERKTAIVLDTNATNGSANGQLAACCVGSSDAAVEYFNQKNTVSSDLIGYIGDLLLNSAGKVVGFVPSADRFEDITVSSAKASGITDANGTAYRITGSATVIVGEELYTWNSTGYVQINGQSGKTARIFYDDSDTVKYVYLRAGTTGVSTEAIVAEMNTTESELARKLGITGSYSITKNGSPALGTDLAQNDVAYFDGATRTMCVSDYRITGYIEAASPAVDGAETITVAGCTLSVLESAWDTLEEFKLGSRVTLLLTDDGKVAAASSVSKVSTEMFGVLGTDGGSVTLCGSGLVLTAENISADARLQGRIVRVSPSGQNKLICYTPTAADSTGKLDITAETLGAYELAPSCVIYEQAGSGSYVYSLSGEQGVSSSDLSEIYWTNELSSSYVSWYRLNSAGQVDILILEDVTGNCYQYGNIRVYTDKDGINLSSDPSMPAYHQAATLTNGDYPSGSSKYLCTRSTSSGSYAGVALAVYNTNYQIVAEIAGLTKASSTDSGSFFQSNGEWYVTVNDYEIPISGNIQVYISSTEQWLSGESGLLTALSSGMTLQVYYDRTLSTGAQVRVLVAQTD